MNKKLASLSIFLLFVSVCYCQKKDSVYVFIDFSNTKYLIGIYSKLLEIENTFTKVKNFNQKLSPGLEKAFQSIIRISSDKSFGKFLAQNHKSSVVELSNSSSFLLPDVPFVLDVNKHSNKFIIQDDIGDTRGVLSIDSTYDESSKSFITAMKFKSSQSNIAQLQIENNSTGNFIKGTNNTKFIDYCKKLQLLLPLKPWGFYSTNLLVLSQDSIAEKDSMNYLYAIEQSILTNKSSAQSGFTPSFDSDFVQKLSELSVEDFKDFYVVDFFPSNFSCNSTNDTLNHGSKVYDVISIVLNKLNLFEMVGAKIKKMPINFFDHKQSCLIKLANILREPLSVRTDEAVFERNSEINQLTFISSSKKGKSTTIPKLYYKLLFNTICNQNTDIISVSFFLQTNDVSTPDFSNTTYNLLAAGFNENKNITFFQCNQPEPGDSKFTPCFFPQQAITMKYPSQGNIIVGGLDNELNNIGSYNEEFVTVHGNATGWQTNNSCIKLNEIGCSYSTPEIATFLFVAKAFWRHFYNQKDINSIDVRNRLVLSCKIVPQIMSQSQGCGIPDLKRLCNIGLPFGVDSVNNISSIRYGIECWTSYPTEMGLPFNTFVNGKETKLYGIQRIDNTLYYCVLNGNRIFWRKEYPEEKLNLRISLGDSTPLITYDRQRLLDSKIKFISFLK